MKLKIYFLGKQKPLYYIKYLQEMVDNNIIDEYNFILKENH